MYGPSLGQGASGNSGILQGALRIRSGFRGILYTIVITKVSIKAPKLFLVGGSNPNKEILEVSPGLLEESEDQTRDEQTLYP